MRIAELISGTLFSIMGLVLAISMLESGIGDSDWFWRTGVNGFLFGLIFLGIGGWSIYGGQYNLIGRSIGSLLLVIMAVIPLFILIGASQGGTFSFILTLLGIIAIYVGTVGLTLYELYRRFR